MPQFFSFQGIGFLDGAFASHVYPSHFHEAFSISVVYDGVLSFETGRQRYDAQPLNISAINPGETHTGKPGCDSGWRFLNMHIPRETVWRLCPATRGRLLEFERPLIEAPQIALSFLALRDVILRKDSSRLEKESVLALVLEALFDRPGAEPGGLTTPKVGRTSTVRCIDYLQTHFDEEVPLQVLAEIGGYSPNHLIRTFARDTGLTPHAYQVQVRLNRALERLRAGAAVKQVAVEVGFFDQSHFTKALKRALGVTPAQIRHANGNNEIEAGSIPLLVG